MKKNRQKLKEFDEAFDKGKVEVDFSKGIVNEGLSKVVKLPPIDIPSWLALEIEKIAKLQGNTRAAVIRQLLTMAVEEKQRKAS